MARNVQPVCPQTMYAFVQDFLPMLVAVVAGYALARWGRLTARPLRIVLRYALFPALLYVLLLDRMEPTTFGIVVAIGAAMAGVGLLLVYLAPRVLRPPIDASAAIPNVACFAIPFLAMGWNSVGLGVACAMFVGVSIVQLAVERRIQMLVYEPWFYAVLAVLVAKLINVLPANEPIVLDVMSPLAAGAYPVLLVFLGASLHPFDGLRDGGAWATAAVRLLAGAGVALVAIAIFPMARGVMEALIIVSLAPPAPKSLSLTDRGKDKAAARSATVVGTLMTLVAMVMLWLINW